VEEGHRDPAHAAAEIQNVQLRDVDARLVFLDRAFQQLEDLRAVLDKGVLVPAAEHVHFRRHLEGIAPGQFFGREFLRHLTRTPFEKSARNIAPQRETVN
jgi:hypothetical protein